MEKKFSIQDVLVASWDIIKNNLGLIIGLQAIVLALNVFPEALDYAFENNPRMETTLLAVAVTFFILQIIANIGMLKIFLGLHDGKEGLRVADLLSGVDYFFEYVLAMVMYGLIVLAGFLLFIVPGIVWSLKYQFFAYLIVDKRMRPLEALKESARITQGQKMNLFWFSCATLALNIAGVLVFGIGLLITIPLTSLALAHIFRKLSTEVKKEPQDTPEVLEGKLN